MADSPANSITDAITSAAGAALGAYVTAGYPSPERFGDVFGSISSNADVVEIGVPFTDPMADGLTIQHAGQVALRAGVSLRWILRFLEENPPTVPTLVMGYYNPFLAFGLDELADALAGAGVAGVIVPDLPLEESGPIRQAIAPFGLALVQLVTPTTPDDRLSTLVGASSGFVYAVTMTGVTGGQVDLAPAQVEYLERVTARASLPVLAGFGVRDRSNVEALSAHVDGVVVGSALIDAIDRGEDPGEFLATLRPVTAGS